MRLFYYLTQGQDGMEALLFADDVITLASRAAEIVELGTVLLIWISLGPPFKWSNFMGGQHIEWIGYWLCLEEFRLGISEKRAAWFRKWVDKALGEGKVSMRDFTAVLGRLCFVMGALEYLRPFVAPLFAWTAAIGHDGDMSCHGPCRSC